MKFYANKNKQIGEKSPMLFGHFLEHFHRQIYEGVYDPSNPLSDEDGFRTDVLKALKDIQTPIIRWPGGCFVSTYNWKKGVGEKRPKVFDKTWRVEDDNSFGTDEFIKLCRKIGCEPYICTNAGTGTIEEMSDWVEYCNLKNEGEYAQMRQANGFEEPHNVKYWSIGNENYGSWELGAKSVAEWGRLSVEAAKLMKHVDPTIELSSAALNDVDWNLNLLRHAKDYIGWMSLHGYWDHIHETNDFCSYEKAMEKTKGIDNQVKKVKGLLTALGLEGRIKIAFDEWNLREWYHPKIHGAVQGLTKEDYLYPRDKNDDNTKYTMADAVFSACFLNMCMNNCDIVKMANFSPVVNTRGCICTHKDGIVLRSTYFVFLLYVKYLGETVLDSWYDDFDEDIDLTVTYFKNTGSFALAVANKSKDAEKEIELNFDCEGMVEKHYISGASCDSYNDVNHTEIMVIDEAAGEYKKGMKIKLAPHSVNVITIK